MNNQLKYVPGTEHIPPDEVIFGRSAEMLAIRDRLRLAARSNVPVLIQGESGTGKDLLARMVHKYSNLSEAAFVKVNCPAIQNSNYEHDLFGGDNGNGNGNGNGKHHSLGLTEGGTLFLDEIAELDRNYQSKLLQSLQDGQGCMIGAQENRVAVRLVCATNRDLQQETHTGHFRADLFYRIAVVTFTLPPLRRRIIDLPELTEYLLQVQREKLNRDANPIPAALVRRMQLYTWPGNIRQLENVITSYVILGAEDVIAAELNGVTTSEEIPLLGAAATSLRSMTKEAVRALESRTILAALEANHWNRKHTAKTLNMSYRGLLYKLKEVGINGPRSREANGRAELRNSSPETSIGGIHEK
jgi:two-component system, NtrC family, response regulator AtoC